MIITTIRFIHIALNSAIKSILSPAILSPGIQGRYRFVGSYTGCIVLCYIFPKQPFQDKAKHFKFKQGTVAPVKAISFNETQIEELASNVTVERF